MEAPDGWNALTAALSVCRLHDLPRTWAFLSLQGLVDDQYDQRAEFLALARAEIELGEITGPSIAWRIANSMLRAGLAGAPALESDPFGNQAARRLAQVASWGEGAFGREQLARLQPLLQPPEKRPWWRIF